MAMMLRLSVQRVGSAYDRIYQKHPLTTAGTTMLSKSGTCDVIAQKIDSPDGTLDWTRTLKFTFFCVAYVGMFQHCVFNIIYPRLFPGEGLRTALKKTLCDNFVHSPFVYLPSFYMYKNMANGKDAAAGLQEYRKEGLSVLQSCWGVWIPAQFVCFYFVPPTFRILYNAGVGCLWDVALSYMSPCSEEGDAMAIK